MKRKEALERLKKPEMKNDFLKNEFKFVANKLGLSENELEVLFNGENKTFRDYKNRKWIINIGTKVMMILGLEKRLFR